MTKVKEMPYKEKYAKVIDNIKFDHAFIIPFVQKHLGDQAVIEIKKTWEEGMKPIPEGASFEKKYEIAYANWIWLAKQIYPFIRQRMSEDGMKKFERAEIEGLIKKNASPALLMLKIIRGFSPGTAFAMTAKQMGYQFQWLTPFSVPELTKQRAVLEIPRCKILDFPDTEDICVIGCQSTYPLWVAEQFKISMKWNRQGNHCTGVLTPIA
ncbi:MAG: hypothetical protein ACQEQ5_00040 [Thermodesulfobacteriota bacterium]